MKPLALITVSLLLFGTYSSACTGGTTNQGTLTPTATFQTVGAANGDYFEMAVSCGNTYTFDFCGNGGAAGSLFAEISILDVGGTVEHSFEPYPGGCTTHTWTAPFTGTIRILITDSGCNQSGAYSGTMAYNETSSVVDPSFSLSANDCSTATATISGTNGGTFAFNPVPGDGAVIDASTGAISNGTAGATYLVDYTICGNTQNNSVTLQTGVPSFTLAASNCDAATATITGASGGTFTFNPAPGDGAIVHPSTGNITNGTGGTTYFLDYTACGSTQNNSVTLPVGNPSFTLSQSCGGGTATITGNTGGTFTWNPAPGDGAQLNASTGAISNGSVGTTYSIQYSVCGTSSTESITVINNDCWILNGDAQNITVGTEQCIQLTPNATAQTGCAWNGSQIDFNSDFTLTLDYYFGNSFNGADGNTFTFQTSASTSCGGNGSQMGAGGIANALAIEFDTYDNDGANTDDLSCDHIAVEIDGDHPDDPSNSPANQPPLCGPICAKSSGGDIDDGGTYQVDINWTTSTNTLEVYFDGVLRLTCVNDFITSTFGGQNQVYWGATSATGGFTNQQYFCPSSIVLLPVEMGTFTSTCENDREIFNWTTISESRVDYFQLEYTYDNIAFYPVDKIDAIGNSQKEQTYTTDILSNDARQRYYRLKMVDDNGDYEYTDIIASKSCSVSSSLVHSISQNEGLNIYTTEDVNISLFNQIGQHLIETKTINQSARLDTHSLQTGIYYIHVRNGVGQVETKKIFIR